MHPDYTSFDVSNVTGVVTFKDYNETGNKEREYILLNDIAYSR